MDYKKSILVSCVSVKLDSPAKAKDLYQSQWFKYAKRYAEEYGDNWAILSAKHGLILPDKIISPYEKTLNNMQASDRKQWAINCYQDLVKLCFPVIEILAGNKYREFLLPLLRENGYTVSVPMQGLGIGQQLAWLKNKL